MARRRGKSCAEILPRVLRVARVRAATTEMAESPGGGQDKAIAGLGEGRTDAAVAEALDGRE